MSNQGIFVLVKKFISKVDEIKATPLSFLNKVVLFPQNKSYCLDMIAAVVVVVAE
ncbi:hypothetical protein OA509_02360 [Prochlorococcus sp. AH-716-I19]|nr:hypothetical protein [Prochlorococcus sp. AH-716-I19]